MVLSNDLNWKRRGQRMCRFCGGVRGLIRKFGLMTCRKCFRERANAIGFHKYS